MCGESIRSRRAGSHGHFERPDGGGAADWAGDGNTAPAWRGEVAKGFHRRVNGMAADEHRSAQILRFIVENVPLRQAPGDTATMILTEGVRTRARCVPIPVANLPVFILLPVRPGAHAKQSFGFDDSFQFGL